VIGLDGLRGLVFRRGEPGYEQARADAVWNARKPARYPAVIVVAADEADVVAAVNYARKHALAVSVRSGGHSWYGIHLRDGGLLLDLSRLREITVDPAGLVAVAQSGVVGMDLHRAVSARGLFFPVGHGPDVGLAGFLLGGGYGWNSRQYGPACFSIVAVDVVTAAGERLHCDEERNADFLWAARGGGHGQFAVITRFHLRLREQPGAIVRSTQVYPLELCAQVAAWMMTVGPALDDRVEFVAMVTRPPVPGFAGAAMTVTATAFADSAAQAGELLAPFEPAPLEQSPLEQAPFAGRELLRASGVRTDLGELGREVERETPKGQRYVCDNIWTGAGAAEITPLIAQAAQAMPNPECQVFWYWWGRDRTPPRAAWSAQAPWYYAVYGIGSSLALDPAHDAWVARSIGAVAHLSSGTQFADANLAGRFDAPLRPAQLAEMGRLRARHDPAGVFCGYPSQED
jgi:FAD/FMN-containing dehydrogenase